MAWGCQGGDRDAGLEGGQRQRDGIPGLKGEKTKIAGVGPEATEAEMAPAGRERRAGPPPGHLRQGLSNGGGTNRTRRERKAASRAEEGRAAVGGGREDAGWHGRARGPGLT